MTADAATVDLDQATREPEIVRVPRRHYVLCDGRDPRDSAGFGRAVRTLFGTGSAISLAQRGRGGPIPTAPNLETWWHGSTPATTDIRDTRHWTLGLALPAPVDDDVWQRAAAGQPVGRQHRRLRVAEMEEGVCVQVLHVGPPTHLADTLNLLRDFLRARDLEAHGCRHEIELSAGGSQQRSARRILRFAVH